MDFPLHLIFLVPLAGAALNLLVGRRLPRDLSALIATGASAASLLMAVVAFRRLTEHGADPAAWLREVWYTWIAVGSFKVAAAFLFDSLSSVMTLIITGVGLLIHIYSIGYMAHERDYARYFAYLNLFLGSMLILVLGDNLLVSFVGWEGVGACSYLLIGFWYDKEANASAGRKAFITNRVGDFGFLLGIFLTIAVAHTLSYSELGRHAYQLRAHLWLGKSAAFWIGALLFIGACGKSAQLPLYVWLPDAMAGPTPVSALIHAATMVTAGIYMVVRLHILYAMAPQVAGAIMIVGCSTAALAALIAVAQTDIKKVLAYSTISQLGFMFVGAAAAVPEAGIFHVMTHAFFKAGLFLGAGSVMHAMSDRTDILQMGGLRKRLPLTHATFLIFCLAIAGCPPLAGFWSKDAILASAQELDELLPHWHHFGTTISHILVFLAAMTSFYMFRLYYLVFSGECRAEPRVQEHIHESPAIMTVPLLLLAFLSMVGGLVGTPWKDLLGEFLGAEAPAHVPWLNMQLGTVAFGSGLVLATLCYRGGVRAPVRGFVRALPWLHRFVVNKLYVDELYDLLLHRPLRAIARTCANGIDRFLIDGVLVGGAARIVGGVGYLTRRLQNGDVQRYVAVMVVGAAALIWRVTPPPHGFSVTAQGSRGLVVQAAAPSKGERYCWRLDGASGCASEKAADTLPVAPGPHTVTLEVRDTEGRARFTGSRSVEVALLEAAKDPAP